MPSGSEVVVGVTGSIGAYKAADVVRRLKEQGCGVTCVLTKEAAQFITPLTLQTLSERKVHADLFSLEESGVVHTTLADQADLLLIAPATANLIGKLANGLADDLLTCVALATRAPILIAPAMNVHMYEHPTVQENVARLKRLGHRFIGPECGQLACGYEAIGHLADVEDIVSAALRILKESSPPRPQSQRRAGAGSGERAPARRGAVRRPAAARQG